MASANFRTIAAPREHPSRSTRRMAGSIGGADTRPRVAYLTNRYPAVSHSFIRTEIAALERLGFAIDRFTIRRGDAGAQGEDADELARTTPLLSGGRALAGAIGRRFARRPAGTLNALRAALSDACRDGIAAGRIIRGFAYFAEAALLADTLDRSGVRHIHVQFGTNPAAVARLACRMASLTFSFTAHGPDEFDAPRAIDLGGKIAAAAFVIAVSSFGRSQLMRWSDPAHWPRIHVVRCAVAPRFLAAPNCAGAAPPARFVAVARLSAQKGLPLLVEAAALLAAERDFTLDLIGDGDQRAAIEAQIARADLDLRVRVLGWRSPEQVSQAVASARALILPSFAEGLPVVLMEALALRRPVITTAIAGIPELVDADTGWLVPAGSVDALVAAMRDALDAGPDRLRAMGAVGRGRVLTMHHPDRNASQIAELLTPLA